MLTQALSANASRVSSAPRGRTSDQPAPPGTSCGEGNTTAHSRDRDPTIPVGSTWPPGLFPRRGAVPPAPPAPLGPVPDHRRNPRCAPPSSVGRSRFHPCVVTIGRHHCFAEVKESSPVSPPTPDG